MTNVTPIIGGRAVLAHGSFIIAPGGDASLDIDGYRINFVFLEDIEKGHDVEVENGAKEMTVKLINPSSLGFAFNLEGMVLNRESVTINLTYYAIGEGKPHRVIGYTIAVV